MLQSIRLKVGEASIYYFHHYVPSDYSTRACVEEGDCTKCGSRGKEKVILESAYLLT